MTHPDWTPVTRQGRGDTIGDIVAAGADRIGAAPGVGDEARELAAMIDHTLLRPEAARADIEKLCDEARRHGFASVCVNPAWIPACASQLRHSPVRVCSVIGFPFGATLPEVKAFETRMVRDEGAQEFDMVINVGALKSRDDALVLRDVEGVVRAAGYNGTVKVILETAYLTDDEKVRACHLAQRAGAHFVKTSTGYAPGGATVADIALMRRTVGEKMGVKASGGIRDAATALRMIEAGASRIGASASVKIVGGGAGAPAGKY
ncbi:MAG: deoxyribose-phosphate aldolase [Planctomycetes bacterium]|nr:deoxyribose-phosphate aldolase [Planctomycetota bacterium]